MVHAYLCQGHVYVINAYDVRVGTWECVGESVSVDARSCVNSVMLYIIVKSS